MRIALPNQWNMNHRAFLQQCGYASIIAPKTGKLSFIRRLSTDDYPRFHVYVEKNTDGKNIYTIHLDQKRPTYQKGRAHMADYSGPLVDEEAGRIKKKIYEQLLFTTPEKTEKRSIVQRMKKFFSAH